MQEFYQSEPFIESNMAVNPWWFFYQYKLLKSKIMN